MAAERDRAAPVTQIEPWQLVREFHRLANQYGTAAAALHNLVEARLPDLTSEIGEAKSNSRRALEAIEDVKRDLALIKYIIDPAGSHRRAFATLPGIQPPRDRVPSVSDIAEAVAEEMEKRTPMNAFAIPAFPPPAPVPTERRSSDGWTSDKKTARKTIITVATLFLCGVFATGLAFAIRDCVLHPPTPTQFVAPK